METTEPKFFNEFVSQFLFDVGQVTPMHLQSMRVSLMAYYKRIRLVEIEADLNENVINVFVKFKWWYVFPKEKFLKKIKGLFQRNLPKTHKMVDTKGGQPVVEQVEFTVNVSRV